MALPNVNFPNAGLANLNLPGITQPMVGFHFAVSFEFYVEKLGKLSSKKDGSGGQMPFKLPEVGKSIFSSLYDTRFSEVSGIGFTKGKTHLPEGTESENLTSPKSTTYADLSLKRALVVMSPLAKWADKWRTIDTVEPKPNIEREKANVMVMLLGTDHLPVIGWSFTNAWPTSYKVSGFNAKSEDLAMEEITLTYENYTMIDLYSVQVNPNTTT
jgi:phage tail-like protein